MLRGALVPPPEKGEPARALPLLVNVLTVPENAVIYDNQKNTTVEIPDKSQKEGKRKIPVKVGLSNGSVTEIASGLKEGDRVVLQ